MGLVAWSLISGSGGGSASNDEAGVEGAEGVESAPASPGSSPSTTAEKVAVEEEMEDEASADTAEPDDAGAPVPVASMPDEEDLPDLALLTEEGTPAVLDEPLGYALLVSGHGAASLLDLDSPRLVELPELRGDVILVTASHMVLASESGPARSVSFDDVGAEPVGLDTGDNWPQLSVGPKEDQAWAMTYDNDDGSQTRTLVDLVTGEAIRSYAILASVSPIDGGPSDLVNVIGGGVFEETSEGHYRRFAKGWALAATSELVLVRRCSGDLSCTGLWMDRQSGAILDYPSPDVQTSQWWGTGIDSSNTWYWTRDPRQGPEGMNLTHIRTGREIALPGMDPWPGPSVSPDGRWATTLDQRLGQMNLVNLETGLIYRVADTLRGSQVIFVPMNSFDSLPQ